MVKTEYISRRKDRISDARRDRRSHMIKAAREMVGFECGENFNPFHTPLCPIDVVMVAGSPWMQAGLKNDFNKNGAAYLKLGGANTPSRAYFYRSAQNLMLFIRHANLFIPRGGHPQPVPGMIAFFDSGSRGRYNFEPDRTGVILESQMGRPTRIVVGREDRPKHYRVEMITVTKGSVYDRDFIGYADCP